MKITAKIELENSRERCYTLHSELTMYNIHTAAEMQEFLNALQKVAGFHGRTVKFEKENEDAQDDDENEI